MHLADIDLLNSEKIHLLADTLQPKLALKSTPVAEPLIQQEQLRSFPTIFRGRP